MSDQPDGFQELPGAPPLDDRALASWRLLEQVIETHLAPMNRSFHILYDAAEVLSRQAAEIERLNAEIRRLQTPDMHWCADDNSGSPPVEPHDYLMNEYDMHGMEMGGAGVAEFVAARSLPNFWIAWRRVIEDPDVPDDFDFEITEHATEADARAALEDTPNE